MGHVWGGEHTGELITQAALPPAAVLQVRLSLIGNTIICGASMFMAYQVPSPSVLSLSSSLPFNALHCLSMPFHRPSPRFCCPEHARQHLPRHRWSHADLRRQFDLGAAGTAAGAGAGLKTKATDAPIETPNGCLQAFVQLETAMVSMERVVS